MRNLLRQGLARLTRSRSGDSPGLGCSRAAAAGDRACLRADETGSMIQEEICSFCEKRVLDPCFDLSEAIRCGRW